MIDTPLWICCTLPGGKESAAHEVLVKHRITSLYLTRAIRLNRHHAKARQRIVRRALLPGYALVGHDGSDDLEHRLRRIEWPASGARVLTGILGHVRQADVDQLVTRSGLMECEPDPVRLRPGDRARFTVGPLLGREVRIRMTRGGKAIVEVHGREITTALAQLEAVARDHLT